LFHELGHNMIKNDWTPIGTEEVMPNLFALHAYEYVFDHHKLIEKLLNQTRIEKLLRDFSKNKENWVNTPNIGFLVFLQLINSFGWNSFKTIFREFGFLKEIPASENIKEYDRQKWYNWIMKFSKLVGLNVEPLFVFWNINFSENLMNNNLHPWLPDDIITRYACDRTKFVQSKYENLLIGNEKLYSSCSET
jgi:hypothetical protein